MRHDKQHPMGGAERGDRPQARQRTQTEHVEPAAVAIVTRRE